ncbi:DUF192 domain-containing protein [Patescibacteria group bacterium]|nr:DUF192 domain-containing protein [Patescibacteria group bacterium]
MSGFLKALIVLLGVALGAAAISIPYIDQINKVQKKAEIKINDQYITADVVKTEAARDKGLGGRSELGINEGMLFIFNKAEAYGFWMKGMEIPIDIVWIYKGIIVGFNENVNPEPGVSDDKLKVYYPPQPVDQVLELRSGRISLLKAKIGDNVYVRPLIPASGILSNPQ